MPVPVQKVNDAAQSGLLKTFNNDNSYNYVTGLCILPIASDDPDDLPTVVRLHQPYSIRTQTFSAKKEQTPPVLPAPSTDGDTLIASTFNFPLPNLVGSAAPTFLYEMSGTYVYLGRIAYNNETGYVGGTYPVQSNDLRTLQSAMGTQTIDGLNALSIDFATGNYMWPFTNFIANSFMDPNLSNTATLT